MYKVKVAPLYPKSALRAAHLNQNFQFICAGAVRLFAFPSQHREGNFFLLTFYLHQSHRKADSTHQFVHSCQEAIGTSTRNCSPFRLYASCECNNFLLKGVELGRANHSLKLMSELEKPCPDPGMISYCSNRDRSLGKHSAPQTAFALVLYLNSFLPLQP